ncbi:hypothetical protein HDV00_000495 [Rhizophlyctis rosea]|nr:hypothetical protein HDV00_000495 [Rhizophlyctis rosea]
MVNQYNKKRKNLTKLNRVKRKSFKVSTKTDAKGIVAAANAEMERVQEAATVAALEVEGSAADIQKAAKNIVAVRKGRVGKSNSVIAPTIIGKQKVRKMMTRTKMLARSAAAKKGNSGDVMMEDVELSEAPSTMETVTEEEQPIVKAVPTATGTTLGGPPKS